MKKIALIFFTIFFISLINSSVLASMSEPRYGINEQTKECSDFFMGDECTSCKPPKGWELISDFKCPVGYKEVENNSSICTPIKNQFCCSFDHSGADGDCEDVIVNSTEQKCAFVEDINKCNELPKNWNRVVEIKNNGRVCLPPNNWIKEIITCKSKIPNSVNDKKLLTQNKLKEALPTTSINKITTSSNEINVEKDKINTEKPIKKTFFVRLLNWLKNLF